MAKFARAFPWILMILAGAALWNFHGRKASPSGPRLDCEFTSKPDQPPVRLGNVTAPLPGLRISGVITDADRNGIHDFEGEASYLAAGQLRKFVASGLVRVAESRAVTGFVFFVGGIANTTTNDFGQDSLMISTLGTDGYLGDHPTQAFVGKEAALKTAYPTLYKCKVARDQLS